MKIFSLRTLMLSSAVALGLLASAPEVYAQTFKLTHQYREGTDARDRAARVFIEELERLGSDIRIRVYPGNSLITAPPAQYDALLQGTIEMAVFTLVYGSGKVPEFSGTILPGAVNSLDHAASLKGSSYHEQLQAIAENNGLHILTWWWTEGGFATRDTPVMGPESVAGLKLRGGDKSIDTLLSASGASVFSMPSTELYSAFQTGVLDGTMTSFESFQSMRLYEQTKHATLGGDYTIFMVLQPLVISKTAWDSLSDEQKADFEAAAEVSNEFFHEEQKKAAASTIKVFEDAGAEVRQMTAEEHAEWVALAQETSWAEFAEISDDARALIDALRSMNQ